MAIDNIRESGAFIPVSKIVDLTRKAKTIGENNELSNLLYEITNYINDTANLLNIKESGFYPQQEFVTGELFTNDDGTEVESQIFKIVINYGSCVTGSKAHNIESVTGSFRVVQIYGTANNTSTQQALPLPYASPTAADNIELSFDATNVNIVTGKDRSAFDKTFIVIKYIKS